MAEMKPEVSKNAMNEALRMKNVFVLTRTDQVIELQTIIRDRSVNSNKSIHKNSSWISYLKQ